MAVKEVGILMEESEVQDLKALLPMAIIEVGMLMEEREVQEAKDKIPIPVTVVGIKTLVMVEH